MKGEHNGTSRPTLNSCRFCWMPQNEQTESQETYPVHVGCAWMGNSPKVAQKHHLQVTDERFEKTQQQPVANPEKSQQCCSNPKERNPGKHWKPAFYGVSRIAAEGFEPPTRGL